MIARLRKSFLILYTSLFLCTGIVDAESFPPQTEAVVQDNEKVMEPSQIEQLSSIVGKLPNPYKVVIIPSTEELTTQEYSNQLFTEYALSQDKILLVFNLDKQELAVKVGTSLTEKGLTEEVVKQTVESFFVPNAKQKSYMTGISVTAERLSEIVQHGGVAPSTPPKDTATNASDAKESGSWLYYIILLLLAMLGSGVYVHLQRKKWTQEMDDIEDWMDKIEEKLKRLDEDPQIKTKDKGTVILGLIERVRKETLAQAEFNLLEAESMCDRFRFKKAGYLVQQTKELLAITDNEISGVQSKLFQTKITEEECERLSEEIHQTCSIVKKKLGEATNAFGISFKGYRELVEQTEKWMDSISEMEDTSTLLEDLKNKKQALLDVLKELEEFPSLKQEVAVTLDQELEQLQGDLKEMLYHGYQIPAEYHENFISEMKDEITKLQDLLAEGHVEAISHSVHDLKEQMDLFYDKMEEIVTKKAMVQYYLKEIPDMLSSLETEEEQLADELEELSVRYSVQEGSIFNYYLQLQQVCDEVGDQLFLVKQMDTGNDLEFIQAADHLEAMQKQMEALLLLREEAYEELEELRKGEFEAKEILFHLHNELVRLEDQLRRRNLPGIPPYVREAIQSGKNSLDEIELVLNQVPLELQKINHLVKEAKEDIQKITKDTEQVFNLSEKVEEKIQLTNRFRRQSEEVDQLLREAEEAFRHAQYEEAYQLASEAYDLAVGKQSRGKGGRGSAFFKKS